MVKICVVALMGLPASGKSTFCKDISKSSVQYNYIHVCYDEMFIFHPESSEETFKEERRKVLIEIEQVLENIEKENSPFKDVIILCDDNNYYAGMRYEVYKICKKHQVSFGQIYFPVDLGEALSRNSTRGATALPGNVIEQMNKRLEEPCAKNQWESNTFIMTHSFQFEELQSFLERCLNNPLISVAKEIEPQKSKASTVHDIDILLRKRISQMLREVEGDVRKEKAKVLNERRKIILSDIKRYEQPETEFSKTNILESLLLG